MSERADGVTPVPRSLALYLVYQDLAAMSPAASQTIGAATQSKLDAPLSGTLGWRQTSTGNDKVTSEQNRHNRRLASSGSASSSNWSRYAAPSSRREKAAS